MLRNFFSSFSIVSWRTHSKIIIFQLSVTTMQKRNLSSSRFLIIEISKSLNKNKFSAETQKQNSHSLSWAYSMRTQQVPRANSSHRGLWKQSLFLSSSNLSCFYSWICEKIKKINLLLLRIKNKNKILYLMVFDEMTAASLPMLTA